MAVLVGDAYVRVHADSAGMEAAIRRQAAMAGQLSGIELLDEFNETVRRHADAKLAGINDDLARAIGTGDWDAAFRGARTSLDRFAVQARQQLIDIDRYVDQAGGGLDDFHRNLDELATWAEDRGVWLPRTFRDANASITDLNDAMDEHNRTIERTEGFWSRIRRTLRNVDNDIDVEASAWRRLSGSVNRTTIFLNRNNETVGRMFGAGSRSEFLNFFGRLVANIGAIPGAVSKGLGSLIGYMADLHDQVTEGTKGLTGWQKGMTGVALAAGLIARTIVPALIAFGVSLGAIVTVVPPLLLLLAHLVAGIVAVAGAIAVGLAVSLLAAIPLVLSLVGGIAALVIGFSGLGDATDEVKAKFEPLIKAWTRLRDALQKSVIAEIVDNLKPLADMLDKRLTPMLKAMVEAAGDALDLFTKLFQSDRMKPFLDAIQKALPNLFATLARALVKFGAGLTAAIKPLLPYAQKLADKMEAAASAFFSWATSKEGQDKIKNWLKGAWETAQKLWGVLKNISSVLGTIITAGSTGGGTPGTDFLSWLQKSLADFDKWLNEPVSGEKEWDAKSKRWIVTSQTRIQRFYEQVGETMRGIKTVLEDIQTALSKIDWEKAGRDLQTFLDVLGKVVVAIGTVFTVTAAVIEIVIGIVSVQITRITDLFTTLPGLISISLIPLTLAILGPFAGAFLALVLSLVTWPVEIGKLIGKIPAAVFGALWELTPRLLLAFALAWLGLSGALLQWPGLVAQAIAKIPGVIAGALAKLGPNLILAFTIAFLGLVGLIVLWPSKIAGMISGIPTAVGRALAGLAGIFIAPFAAAYSGIKSWLDRIAALVAGFTLGFGGIAAIAGVVAANQRAAGGIIYGPEVALIGEAGREAIVPLDRPLSMVDPSVRSLAAYAQGRLSSQNMAGGRQVVFQPGSIIVNSPSANPAIVAEAVVDRIAARVLV